MLGIDGTGVIQEHQEWRCCINNHPKDGGLYGNTEQQKVNKLKQESAHKEKTGNNYGKRENNGEGFVIIQPTLVETSIHSYSFIVVIVVIVVVLVVVLLVLAAAVIVNCYVNSLHLCVSALFCTSELHTTSNVFKTTNLVKLEFKFSDLSSSKQTWK